MKVAAIEEMLEIFVDGFAVGLVVMAVIRLVLWVFGFKRDPDQ